MAVRGAVVIGGYANGVGVARALGRFGVPVHVVLTMSQDIAHHSRYVHGHSWLLQLSDHPASLIELLQRNAARSPGRLLLPPNDHARAAPARETLATAPAS